MDGMVLEKIICLYDSCSKSGYPQLWMSFMCFGRVDLKNGQNIRIRDSTNEPIERALPDSPDSSFQQQNLYLFLRRQRVSVSGCRSLRRESPYEA